MVKCKIMSIAIDSVPLPLCDADATLVLTLTASTPGLTVDVPVCGAHIDLLERPDMRAELKPHPVEETEQPRKYHWHPVIPMEQHRANVAKLVGWRGTTPYLEDGRIHVYARNSKATDEFCKDLDLHRYAYTVLSNHHIIIHSVTIHFTFPTESQR